MKITQSQTFRGISIIILLFLTVFAFSYQPPHNKPGPASDKIMFHAFDVDRAPLDLEAGNMDLYMYSLKTEAAEQLKRRGTFSLYQAPASTISLLLNPAPAPQGQLNPFSIKEIRHAMQYLVNRDFIARDIYRGMAVPMISHISPQDFDYLTIYDIERTSGITYDPEYGRQIIAKEMRRAGAGMADGKWYYRGMPVRVKIIGRVEDERRNIADLIRAELEKAGFDASISYRPFAAAIISVYSSDPKTFEWHIYTEGWGRSAVQRYDFATVNQMYAPWLGNMPGWQEVGFWQYSHPELDRLGKQLFRGEFGSLEERNSLYRRMTQLGLDESVRIWLVTAVNTFPAKKNLKGITPDLVSGLRSPWSLREASLQGKSDLTVGHLWVWTERTTWNPVGGFGDVYSADIWRYLHDPPLWNHPFTGIPQPMRAGFEVETAGPGGKLSVPPDAVLWDAENNRWTGVGGGVRAVSKVTFDYSRYFRSKWHHDQPITMADIFYSIAQSFELAYDRDKNRIEVALGVTARPYLETFKGFCPVGESKVEVYVDYWHFEENHIASYASPAGLSMPWEILAAMDDLVFRKRRAAYSDTAASRFNVTWISLVMDRDARLVERTLRDFERRSYIPEGYFNVGGRKLVNKKDAEARYQAALEWFRDKRHLVISNGPFYLSKYDPPAQYAELNAFRDSAYPFKPGDWYFGYSPEIEISSANQIRLVPGESAGLKVQVQGPGKTGLQYLLFDTAARTVIARGEAEQRGEPTEFYLSIDSSITSKLFPGLYELHLIAYSDAIAKTALRTVDVDVLF